MSFGVEVFEKGARYVGERLKAVAFALWTYDVLVIYPCGRESFKAVYVAVLSVACSACGARVVRFGCFVAC